MMTLEDSKEKVKIKWIFQNLNRTALSIIMTVSMAAIMTTTQGFSDNRSIGSGLYLKTALPDLLLDLAPIWFPHQTADILLHILICTSVFGLMVKFKLRSGRDGFISAFCNMLRTLRRFCWCLGIGYGMRTISIMVTTMPPSDPRCFYQNRGIWQLLRTGFDVVTGRGQSCSDKIFSGHSLMATLLGCFWISALGHVNKRPDQTNTLPKDSQIASSNSLDHSRLSFIRKIGIGLVVIWVLSIYLACVLCRNHYSVDVVIASIISTLIFSIYFTSLRMIQLVGTERIKQRGAKRSSNALYYSSLLKGDIEDGFVIQMNSMNISNSPYQDESDGKENKGREIEDKFESFPGLLKRFLKIVNWMDGGGLVKDN